MNTHITDYPYKDGNTNESHTYLRPALQDFARSLRRGSRIADLGCGNGALTSVLSAANGEVHGIDGSTSGIQWAIQSHANIHFRCGDVTGDLVACGLDHGSYDAVVAAEVIEHVYAPRRLVRNAFDLLKPGGTVLLTTPYHGYLKNLAIALTGGMDTHFTALWDGGHIKFWSTRTMTRLLQEAGFVDICYSGAGRCPYFWKSMIVKARKPFCPVAEG